MSLLYPLMAFGMLFAAVPIWLHLRRRDENNLVEFSTLRFLDDQPVARARPLWPRDWPLLLLRLLALLLLVMAFMWPYLESEQAVVVEESRVYILDNTLSHQVDGAFAKARDQVAQELAEADVRTQIGVVELASTARTLVRFGDDPAAASDRIGRLEPSAERGVFLDAFRSAGEMLSTSLGAQRRIVLLSDSQANQWVFDGDRPPFPSGTQVDLPEVSQATPVNRSLSDPRARRAVREGRHWVQAGVFLETQGLTGMSEVVFRSRGREVAREQVAFAEEEAEQSKVVFAEWECDPSEWVVGEILMEGEADALAGDDRVVFSLPPLRLGRVELLADSLFLRRALAPEVMAERWEVQISDKAQLAERTEGKAPDVVCVESHMLSSSNVREAIRDDLGAGRGVILFVNEATLASAGFLRDLGIELQTPQVAPSKPATFRYVFAEHPIFAPFRSADLGNIAEVEFSDYRRLKVRESIALAFAASGDPLVFEANVTPGRMLVFAFACDRRDTNWPIHPTFIPFLDKSLSYVRGEAFSKQDYVPGESVVWELPPGTEAKQVLISTLDSEKLDSETLDSETFAAPDDRQDSIRVDVRDRKASFSLPSRAGHYAVRYDDRDEVAAILDANPSPLESDLVYDAEPDIVRLWQQGSETIGDPVNSEATNRLELSSKEALQQRYWWYVLLAAVAVFLAETVFSARASHPT